MSNSWGQINAVMLLTRFCRRAGKFLERYRAVWITLFRVKSLWIFGKTPRFNYVVPMSGA